MGGGLDRNFCVNLTNIGIMEMRLTIIFRKSVS